MKPASSPAHQRITLSGFPFATPGTWSKKTGGRVAATARRHHEGGELFKEEVAGGPSTTENITVQRQYRIDRDAAMLAAGQRHAGRAYGNVSIQDLDETGAPFGRPRVRNVLLLEVADIDHDADSQTDHAMIEFVLAPTGETA
jgi:hypothetical protein